MNLDPSVILDYWPMFIQGALLTLRLAIIAFVFGLVIGAIVAVLSLTNFWPLRILVAIYLGLMRGIPFIIIVFLVHFCLPAIGFRMAPLTTGTLALTLFAGAYYAEIIRGTVQALPKGQWESARVIGMSPTAAARHVIVPQIISPAVPPVVNCTMTMIKESSVISSITVAELTYQGLVVQGNTFAPFEVFITVALIYWVINFVFGKIADVYEKKVSGGDATRRRMGPLSARYLTIDKRVDT
jgi:His/Glu/Gln/Arg/opine family amino acid ABC transporter permease subunit